LTIGGCTYHVAHPGGRSYESFPVNSFEAEARRITRFWDYGHSPGVIIRPPQRGSNEAASEKRFGERFTLHDTTPRPMSPPFEELDRDYPCTLDLRRQHG